MTDTVSSFSMTTDGIALQRMTVAEAQECVAEIRTGIVNVGRKLLELYERDGWKALGYSSWRECAQVEFGFKQSHIYRLLDAAEVERNISPNGGNLQIAERQARPLVSLPPDAQREVWAAAVETAPNGKVTAAHVQATVNTYRSAVNIEDAYGHVETVVELPAWAVVDDEPIRPSIPHVANNSGNNEWYTPAEYIEAAKKVMGCIDLDPASSLSANAVVGATRFYSVSDNGLQQDWAGKVWLNPPYAGELIGKFAAKLAQHVSDGDVTEAIVLVNNATETAWFADIVRFSSAIVFPKSRVRFWQENGVLGAPLQGQAILYIGVRVDLFLSVFSKFGWGAHVP